MWSRVVAVVASLAAVLAPSASHAVFHVAHISEIMVGAGGDPTIQYVEIRMDSDSQAAVATTRLTTFSCDGTTKTVILDVPGNVVNAMAGQHWIMASPSGAAFLAASGINTDFTWDSTALGKTIPTPCGQVCWGAPGLAPAPPANWDPNVPNNYVDCIAYGGYTGPTKTADPDNDLVSSQDGTPTNLPPGNGTFSLTRLNATGNDNLTDFALECPSPTNNNGDLGGFGPCTPPTTTTTNSTTTSTSSTTTTIPSSHASKCTSKEFSAAGKKAAAKAKCQSKATSKGDTSKLNACLTGAEDKFSTAYPKAVAAGDCVTTADASTVEGDVDAFISALTQTLTNGSTSASKCTSKEFAAAGKKAAAKVKCYSKAAKKNDTSALAGCLATAEGKFTTAFGKATAAGDCLTPADASTVEGDVDDFVSALKNDLDPALP